jgi:glycine hydroxymethyltransferase
VVTNRNSVPADPNGAWYTSGVRIGTPALTSRGFGTDEFTAVANLIADVLEATTPAPTKSGAPGKAKYILDTAVANSIQSRADELLAGHPLYPGLEL